jgi:hypothetical protein
MGSAEAPPNSGCLFRWLRHYDAQRTRIDVVTLDLHESALLNQSTQPSPAQEIPSVSKMPGAGQTFDDCEITCSPPRPRVPGQLVIHQDDPALRPQNAFGFLQDDGTASRKFLVKRERNDDALESGGPKRKMGRVGADEKRAGVARGGIPHQPGIDIQTEHRPSLSGHQGTLSARAAADIKNRVEAGPGDESRHPLLDIPEEGLEDPIVKPARKIAAGIPYDARHVSSRLKNSTAEVALSKFAPPPTHLWKRALAMQGSRRK